MFYSKCTHFLCLGEQTDLYRCRQPMYNIPFLLCMLIIMLSCISAFYTCIFFPLVFHLICCIPRMFIYGVHNVLYDAFHFFLCVTSSELLAMLQRAIYIFFLISDDVPVSNIPLITFYLRNITVLNISFIAFYLFSLMICCIVLLLS